MEKKVGSAYTEVLYDQSGESLGENNRSSWTQSYVNFAGRHLAIYANNSTYFTHVNSLGSTVMVSDYTGAIVEDKLFYPWGQDWQTAGTLYEERFAKLQRRDSETSLDPTPNRMFSSAFGRWLSPDPLHGDVSNPQSLNRYAYASSNPMSSTDPSGAGPRPPGAPPPCYSMVCADQYYGGSMFIGFSDSIGKTICVQDGVETLCGSINWDSVGFCPTEGINAGCAFGYQILQSGPPPIPVATPPQDPGCGATVVASINGTLGQQYGLTFSQLGEGEENGGNWDYTLVSDPVASEAAAQAIADQINNGPGFGPGDQGWNRPFAPRPFCGGGEPEREQSGAAAGVGGSNLWGAQRYDESKYSDHRNPRPRDNCRGIWYGLAEYGW